MSCYVVSNGTFYAVPARSNELYHYGVPGMKWGVRKAERYEAKARSHAAKVGTSKTRLGKSYHNYMSYANEVAGGNQRVRNAGGGKGGILKKIDNVYGHGANARMQEAASKYYDRQSSYTKTRLGTSMAKSAAYNNKTAAEANKKLHDSKSIQEYGKNFVNGMYNRSIKTWSGRTTTTGERMVDNLLTGGTIGAMADYAHYAKTSKKASAKKEYKSRTDKAFKDYESSIADIERNYKRGQRLSKEDQAREEAVERKYSEEVKRAKDDYKRARRG